MKDYGKEVRKILSFHNVELQLKRMRHFGKILELAEQFNNAKVVFGGDFNMRDKELRKFTNNHDFFHTNIVDMWDNSEDNRYTWDLGKLLNTKIG